MSHRKTSAYGTYRDFRKIDIFIRYAGVNIYQCSTTWARTCREAVEIFRSQHSTSSKVFARYAK